MHIKSGRTIHTCTSRRRRPRKNARLVDILHVCQCVSWRIKMRIIKTLDCIPYKFLDKKLSFFFYSSLRPLLSFLPWSKPQVWSHTPPWETSLSEDVPISHPTLHPLFSPLSFTTSSPHSLIARLSPAVLQSAWKKNKHSHSWEEMYPAQTMKAGKRGNCLFHLLRHSLSYSIIRIFPFFHSGGTSTSRFLSPFL